MEGQKEKEKNMHPVWKVVVDRPFRNCKRLYPVQQRRVRQIIDYLAPNPNVVRITVFGSSVTKRCTVDSDVDLYVELEYDQSHLIREYMPFLFDLWTNYTVDVRMLREIEKKGVIVYEKEN